MAERTLPLAPSAEESHRTKGLVRLTMACNERCPFCNVPMEDYPERTPPAEASLAAVEAAAAAGERTLTISGGEPTLLRKRLLALTRAARERGIPFVEVQTNAVLIDDEYAEELAAAGVTSAFVSLLADEAPLHDVLAGLEGAFERCLHGIDALLDAGIRVTLNPVFAASTEDRVARYVDFVAGRLPGVRSISLSAVQPHGRAAQDLSLLPHYGVLGPSVREARRRAAAHGIELLNPYCGLPACVGWEDDLAHSVEAIEALEAAGATFGDTSGIDNRGNKRHGPPCEPCALRPRCGGAWHAYWDAREGDGIASPARIFDPFGDAEPSALETVVDAATLDEEALRRLGRAETPTVWLRLASLREGDAERLLGSGCTHLALVLGPAELIPPGAAHPILRELDRRSRALPSQARPQVWVGLRPDTPRRVHRAIHGASSAGAAAVRLLARAPRWQRLVAAVGDELPDLDLALVTNDA